MEDDLLKERIVLGRKLLDSSAVREVQFLDLRSGQTEDLQQTMKSRL